MKVSLRVSLREAKARTRRAAVAEARVVEVVEEVGLLLHPRAEPQPLVRGCGTQQLLRHLLQNGS